MDEFLLKRFLKKQLNIKKIRTFAAEFLHIQSGLNDLSDKAFGVSGQGNSVSKVEETSMNAAKNERFAASPDIAQSQIIEVVEPLEITVDEKDKRWFPMRIAFGRPERTVGIKDYLDQCGVENFLPMSWKKVYINGRRRRRLLPAIDNLIFIRTSENCLKDIKRTRQPLLPLRFMMRHFLDRDMEPVIISIPNSEMENFMRVAAVQDRSVMFLGNKDFSGKIGRKVRILKGSFQGVKGTIFRVKKDRRVVINLDGICSVAIACINPDFLEEI